MNRATGRAPLTIASPPSLRSLIGWGRIQKGIKLEAAQDGVFVAPAAAAAAP